ncbi:GNAT family N-acetyltransferase [Xanthovirga aplysinae]|uniref:GNAT family N-acetyltransferase n=1 Tax=Xanthovirga aplysinae TaxID=2529853 RepID=UPI001CA3FB32|nr:GNAT family N-acetyltransferase [Xanthovirga aplysinae]
MIRRATLNDLKVIVPLFDQYMVFYNKPSNFELHTNYLRERLEKGEAIIFLAFNFNEEEKKKAIGFTLIYTTFSKVSLGKVLTLNDLFVELAYRERGYGEALIKRTIEQARQMGAIRVGLETAKDNFSAQQLYHKMGFVREEEFLAYNLPIG